MQKYGQQPSLSRSPVRPVGEGCAGAAAPRAAFAHLIDMGWTDAIRTLHPDAPMFTFWSYLRNRWPRDAGLRLDHLLLSPAVARRLKAASVDRDVRDEPDAIDHAPAWIKITERR